MIIVGFFACLRSLVAYPYEFSPGMYDYNYSSCLTSDINCDYSYEDVFGVCIFFIVCVCVDRFSKSVNRKRSIRDCNINRWIYIIHNHSSFDSFSQKAWVEIIRCEFLV
jgi:hypothetical protein